MDSRTTFGTAARELALIVVGVVIALAFNSWYQRRSEAAELINYLERLVADLETDSATFQFTLDILDDKDAALDQVAQVALGLSPPDSSFFSALATTQYMGFQTPRERRVTFDELLATGRLRLIQDAELRARLVEYYWALDARWLRIDRRRTAYPEAVYRLDPSGWARPPFESAFSRMAAQAIDSVRTPTFLNLLNAERTLSLFQRDGVSEALTDVVTLLATTRASQR